jgi:antitoxin FitA
MRSWIAAGRGVAVATNLVVRNIEEQVARALKQAAAAHGRSAEAEHREILRRALMHPARRSAAEVLGRMPNVGLDSDFDVRKRAT